VRRESARFFKNWRSTGVVPQSTRGEPYGLADGRRQGKSNPASEPVSVTGGFGPIWLDDSREVYYEGPEG
jgi:hypothetical protein